MAKRNSTKVLANSNKKEVADMILLNIKMILEIILITLEIIVLVKNNFKPKNNKKNHRSSGKN